MKVKLILIALALLTLPTLISAQDSTGNLYNLIRKPVSDSNFSNGNPNYVQLDRKDTSQCKSFIVGDGDDYFLPYGFHSGLSQFGILTSTGLWYNIGYSERTWEYTGDGVNPLSTTGYAIYLPYDFTLPTELVGYELKVYHAHDKTDPKDNTFVFVSIDSKNLKANTPYLVRVENATASHSDLSGNGYIPASPVGVNHSGVADVLDTVPKVINANGDTIELARSSVVDNTGVTWTISGTTEKINADNSPSGTMAWADGSYVFGSDGKWWNAKAAGWDIPAFRVIMHPSVAGAVASKSMFGGFVDKNGNVVTGIDKVIYGNQDATPAIYSVSGQYLGKDINVLPKGIYIVNGKKVMK